jgi:hypothetical protein
VDYHSSYRHVNKYYANRNARVVVKLDTYSISFTFTESNSNSHRPYRLLHTVPDLTPIQAAEDRYS